MKNQNLEQALTLAMKGDLCARDELIDTHRDFKETLLKVALRLSNEPVLLQFLNNNKLLPLKELESITGMKRRILEKGRKYLIALVLILTDSKFYPLKSFTEIPGISIEEKVPPQ